MIEFRAVSKRFPDGTVAVNDFSLVIPSRQTTVLVGSSGSGKTTLLRMINRMVDPTDGVVEIDGENVANAPAVALRRRIGYVMQNSGLLPHRTVADNVSTVPGLNGASKRDARARALELLDIVGLDRALADRYPSQLSGGQQQRVGVARGLAADPEYPADGRTVRGGGPHRSGRPATGTHPAAARTRQDGRLRHPRHRRGVSAGGSSGDSRGRRRRSCKKVHRARSSPIPPTISWRPSSVPIEASVPSAFATLQPGACSWTQRGALTAVWSVSRRCHDLVALES